MGVLDFVEGGLEVSIFGALERRKASTVMPVPPGTARHQLVSVPPTGRAFSSTAIFK